MPTRIRTHLNKALEFNSDILAKLIDPQNMYKFSRKRFGNQYCLFYSDEANNTIFGVASGKNKKELNDCLIAAIDAVLLYMAVNSNSISVTNFILSHPAKKNYIPSEL